MPFLLSFAIALGVAALVGLILREVFKRMDLAALQSDYIPCAGKWHESEIHGCSTGLHQVPQQPVNTYTNMAYLAGGLLVGLHVRTPESWVFVVVAVYHSIGSALYHAVSTRWATNLDFSGMYGVFSALTALAACALLDVTGWLAAAIILVVAGLAAYFLRYRYKGDFQVKIGIFLLLIYGLTLWHMGRLGRWDQHHYLLFSFLLFLAGYFVWNLDLKRTFPLAGKGHGLWHLMTACAIVFTFFAVTYA